MTIAGQLADIPADRAVHLRGAEVARIALSLAEDDTGLAAVVAKPAGPHSTPAGFVEAALADLERVAVELAPVWLPDVLTVSRPDLGGLAAIRLAAAAQARRAHYAPPLLTDLAVLAIAGRRDPRPELPFRTRAGQLARLIAESFGRRRTALLVPLPGDLTPAGQDAIVSGAGWLAHNARMAVWLIGPLTLTTDQLPSVRLADVSPRHPALIGKPHPGSAVEAALEAALAVESWAHGRRWNQTYSSGPLHTPVRLDLIWPDERCVVEIDGPEHCHPVHFEADRQRDVQLHLDGWTVLRFTNARIIHDVGAVVHQIGTFLHGRRRDIPEGTPPWPATTSPPPRTRF